MGALLRDDIIVSLSGGSVNIGPIPKGVGLERLRWDGSKLIDLTSLKEMHITNPSPGIFELHAIKVAGSQLVSMSYSDRGKLINDNGMFRLLTEAEIAERNVIYQKSVLKVNTREVMNSSLGDLNEQMADLTKMLYLGIIGLRTNDKDILAIIDSCLADMQATYDMAKAGASLAKGVKTLKELMSAYYTEASKIG